MRFKRSLFYLFILILFLTFNMISCGGGGGGGGTVVPTTVSGFIKIVEATGPDDGANIGGADSARYMMLYRAQDIQASGMISVISLKRYAEMGSSINCPNVTVKMGHTDVTGLDATFANNVEQGQGAFTTVINNASINVPAGAADTYFDITLPQAFNYNGVDNLIVEITRTTACTGDLGVTYHGGYDGANMNTDSSTATDGTVYPVVVDARFVFSGGDNIAVPPTGSYNAYPFSTFTSGQKVQLLYSVAEINGSGIISGIAFPVGEITTAQTYTINVRIGHTTFSELTNTFADNFNSGSPVTVASAANFSLPAGVPVDSYVWLPLPDATFNYNGTDNLILEVEVTSASGITWWKTSSDSMANRRLVSGVGELAGAPDNERYAIKFRFAGGTMDVITNDTVSLPSFSGSQANRQQFLYRAAELGTKGNITHLAFRVSSVPQAASYDEFVVRLGYATGTTLGDTSFAANITGAQTVYSETFNVTSGLKVGDWIVITLSTPFAYDGISDLVVDKSSLAGTGTNNLFGETNNSRYPAREAYYWDSNTVDNPDGTSNNLVDLRLTLQ